MFGVCRGCCRSACIVTRIDDPHRENAVVSSGESPAKRRRRRHNAAAAVAHRASWISVADQKRRFEAGLWYQNMSRVRPECPQATPREERKASCIRKAYGEHSGAKVECRMKEGRAKPPKVTSKPPQSLLIARGLRPQSHLHTTCMRPSSHPQAWGKCGGPVAQRARTSEGRGAWSARRTCSGSR
jgi:hypothetical protein